jgi:phosphate starvation-inducible PhoH-like protein
MGLVLTLHPNLTTKQKSVLKARGNFLILKGPAGTSKTYIAIARGLKLLSEGKVVRLVIIRSAVESRPMGFMPGDQAEKLDPYSEPYVHLFKQLSPKRGFRAMVSSDQVEFHSTSYLRGVTFDKSYIIVDEYQNMNAHELETIATRVGDGTHLVFCGDTDQTDLKYNEAKEHLDIMATLESMPDFQIVEFVVDDIVRSDFVKRYYKAKAGVLDAPKFLYNLPKKEQEVFDFAH